MAASIPACCGVCRSLFQATFCHPPILSYLLVFLVSGSGHCIGSAASDSASAVSITAVRSSSFSWMVHVQGFVGCNNRLVRLPNHSSLCVPHLAKQLDRTALWNLRLEVKDGGPHFTEDLIFEIVPVAMLQSINSFRYFLLSAKTCGKCWLQRTLYTSLT